MTKKWISVSLSTLLAMGILGGTTSVVMADTTPELTLMVTNQWTDTENNEYAAKFAEKIEEFEKEYNCKVTLEGASQQDIKENFQTAALAGGGADMVIMDSSGHAIDLAAMGLLLPLSTFTTAEELEATYQAGPLNSGKYEGEYYSMPWYMDCCGLYYNQDILNECNVEVPTTWDELLEAIKTVTASGHGGISTYLSAYAFYSSIPAPVIIPDTRMNAM